MTEMEMKLRYVAKERMRSGKIRWRFQRGGQKVTLRGTPGSPEFLTHYAELLDGVAHTADSARARTVKGSIAWLVGRFLADVDNRVAAGLASPLTLKGHRHHLGRLVDRYGPKDARMPTGKLTEFLDEFTATPGARDNLRKSISAMFQWGIERELVPGPNPAAKIRRINRKTAGFYTCTIEDVRAYLRHHGPGTTARRVMILALCTAARREDLRTLGRHNEVTRDGQTWLRWRQSKAPHGTVEIPMLPMLAEELAGHDNGVYVLTSRGAPFSHGSLGNMVRGWFDEAGARGSLHGIRKGLSAILPELGASSYELDVLLGHTLGSRETKTYVATAERAAIAKTLGERMRKIEW